MKNRKFKRICAVILTVILVCTSIPATAFAAFDFTAPDGMYLISNTEKNIAPGVSENAIITNDSTGDSQVMGYAVSVDMSEGSTASFMAGYADYSGSTWKMQTVRQQAAACEKATGANVVAAFNADAFNMQTGEPLGCLILNGNVYKQGLGRPYFAILNDGTPVIGESLTADLIPSIKEAVSGFFLLAKDGQRYGSGFTVDTLYPKTCVGIKGDGTVIVYVADGRNYPTSCGLNNYDLASIMLGMGCVDVINLDGGGSATYAAQYEGSDSLVVANKPSDGVERKVSSCLFVTSSARPTGEFDHASLTPNNEVYTPNSTVQFSATGVDSAGGSAELPADGQFVLAADSASMGTITAEGNFLSNGTVGTVNVNYVSNSQVCGTVSIEIVIPDTLYVPKNEVSLGFEDTTDFGIVAKYNDRTVIMNDNDITWSITDDENNDLTGIAGNFSGRNFTTLDGITVNANVVAALSCNSDVTASIRAIIGAMPVVMYDFEYTTDAQEAADSDTLQYIPTYKLPRFDRSIGTTSPQQANEFYNQGYPLYCWPNASLTDQDSMKATVVSKEDGEPVRFGDHSLKIDYNYASYNGSKNSNNYLRVTSPSYFFEGSPTAIGCWVYIPEGTANFMLYLNCSNKDENLTYMPVTGTNGIDWTGWRYVEFDLSDTTLAQNAGNANAPFGFYQGCGVFWISYQVGGNKGDRTASTVYLDNIQLVYGANTDDIDNPIISSVRTDEQEIADGETVFTSNTNTFKASFEDFDGKYSTGIDFSAVKMYIDGVDKTDKCYINEGDEEIYLYDANLANGTHSIEIEVSDLFGNTTTETRYFTVDSTEAQTEVSLVPETTSPVLGEEYVLDIVSNDTNVASADVSLKILSNFVKYWNNYTVIPGDGYTLDGDAKYDESNSVISFKATRNADATDENKTVAKIAFSIPSDVPNGLAVTYRIAKGALTLSNGDDSSFSGKITTTCVSPFVVDTDTMIVGSDGGYVTVTDTKTGSPIENANIFTEANELIGTTDENGKLFTDKFVSAVAKYSIYAQKDTSRSFIFTSQSFPSGGSEDGMPSYIKLNGSTDPTTMQSISWMASPLASGSDAVVSFAEKAEYEANPDTQFTTVPATSDLIEMSSTAMTETNYAVRVNHTTLTGLKPGTEYVYTVGDGTKTSAIKQFSTTILGQGVNFFVIGDTQATDTTNTDEITKLLGNSGVDYSFGIQTGDAVDNGGNYTMWENIAKVFSGDFLGNEDMIQVLGNHEYYGDLTGTSASAYFDLPGTENQTAPLCYSMVYGNVYVAVINYGGISNYEAAAEWVAQDAANSNATWKILTTHQPTYYTNPSGNSSKISDIFKSLADEVGFDFVFSGHDHSYARTMPIKGGEVNDDGTVYYICGSTGEKSYEIIPNDSFHFDVLNGDYNATFITANVTDTTFTITTHDYTAGGADDIIDQYTKTKDVDCTENGHDYVYDNGNFYCGVCNYPLSATNYTGFATDAQTGRTMYFINGEKKLGWFTYINDSYYFDENGLAVTGTQKIGDIDGYEFDETGKQINGVFVTDESGTRCYRGGTYLKGWHEIAGDLYYFSTSNGVMRTGASTVTVRTGQRLNYTFSSDGKLLVGAFYTNDDGTVYFWGGDMVNGWQEIEGNKYYFDTETNLMCTDEVELDGKVYAFNSDGQFVHEGSHTWDTVVTILKPSCTVDGKKICICSECGTSKVVVEKATGHIDEDSDGKCDVCSKAMDHNSDFENFFYGLFNRIINRFWSIIEIITNNFNVFKDIIIK